MKPRDELLNFALRSASRSLVSNDRAWGQMVAAKTKQVAELETVMQRILMLCATSSSGTVSVDAIYETLSGVRQE